MAGDCPRITRAVSLADMNDTGKHDTSEPASEELLARITHVEELLTHLQRSLQGISDVVVDQQKRSDQFERDLARLTERLHSFRESEETDTDIEDECPPHY